jgi:hypothetical protein
MDISALLRGTKKTAKGALQVLETARLCLSGALSLSLSLSLSL